MAGGWIFISPSPDGIIGGDNKWIVKAHPEFRYGSSTNGLVGVIPEQSRLFFPQPDGEEFDLALSLTRRFEGGGTLSVGKFNLLDVSAALPIVGGGGIEGFQNLAIALPPSGVVPSSITGAILNLPIGDNLFRFWLFDPNTQVQRSGLGNLFGDGVSALAAISIKTNFANKPGFRDSEGGGQHAHRDRPARDPGIAAAAGVLRPGAGAGAICRRAVLSCSR